MSSIGRRFDRQSSSIFSVLSPSGGIRPSERKRSERSLSPKAKSAKATLWDNGFPMDEDQFKRNAQMVCAKGAT